MPNPEKTAVTAPTGGSLLTNPTAGTVFTVLSGLTFLFTAMILPLVGKAGVRTVHARQNFIAFLSVLLCSLVTGALATYSKMSRRATDGSPLPLLSMVLTGLCTLLLIALLLGLLKI